MKKSLSILLTILLLIFCNVAAFADETPEHDFLPMESEGDSSQSTIFEEPTTDTPIEGAADGAIQNKTNGNGKFTTAGDLYQHWIANRVDYETSPYPLYICGVYSTDGGMEKLTFAVTKNEVGEAGKAEILALVSDESTVSFTYQGYPYAELWRVQLELTPYLGDKTGANSLGIDEMQNVLLIGINEENENSVAFMKSSFEKYGKMIQFEQNDGITFEDSHFRETRDKGLVGGRGFWYFFMPLVMILSIGIFLFSRHRLVPIMQTNTGGVTTNREITSTRQVKEMVQNAKIIPSAKLDAEILSRIKEM